MYRDILMMKGKGFVGHSLNNHILDTGCIADSTIQQPWDLTRPELCRSPRREEAWACRAGSGGLPVFDVPVIDRPIVDYRAKLTADCERIKRFDQECGAREAPLLR